MLEFIIVVAALTLFIAGMVAVRRKFRPKTAKVEKDDDLAESIPTGTTMDTSFANEGPEHSLAHDTTPGNTVTYAESFGKDTVVVEVKRNKKESDDKPRKVVKVAKAAPAEPKANVPKALLEVRKKIVDRRNLLARFGIEEATDAALNNLYQLENELVEKTRVKTAETKNPVERKPAMKKDEKPSETTKAVKKTTKKPAKKTTTKAAKKPAKKPAKKVTKKTTKKTTKKAVTKNA